MYFDFVCSLGGNCSVAHNLLIRNMRIAAFPFDWIYYKSDDAIYKIEEGFNNNFTDFMKKANLKLLPDNQSHINRLQYEDTYANIVYANQFYKSKNWNKEYEKVFKKFRKRFDRLINYVDKSKKILFLVALSYEADISHYKRFLDFLANKYYDKYISVRVLSFSCNTDNVVEYTKTEDKKLSIYMYKRSINNYDYTKTNFEWSFLDDIEYACNKRKNNFIMKLIMLRNSIIKRFSKLKNTCLL